MHLAVEDLRNFADSGLVLRWMWKLEKRRCEKVRDQVWFDRENCRGICVAWAYLLGIRLLISWHEDRF